MILIVFLAFTCTIKTSGEGTATHASTFSDTVAQRLYEEGRKALKTAFQLGSYALAKTELSTASKKLEQAVARDPGHAAALAALAATRILTGIQNAEARNESRVFAEKALTISDTLPDAHTALGWLRFYELDFPGSKYQFERALALSTDASLARLGYGLLLATHGEFEHAIAEVQHAEKLGVVHPPLRWDLSTIYFMARQYDKAVARSSQKDVFSSAAGKPDYFWLGLSRLFSGDAKGAVTALEERVKESNRVAGAVAALAQAYHAAGDSTKARELLNELTLSEKTAGAGLPLYRVAAAHLATGDTERAFMALERGAGNRQFWFVWLNVDPTWDSIRSHPRFIDLLRKVGFAGR